jgi:hypothetical protein
VKEPTMKILEERLNKSLQAALETSEPVINFRLSVLKLLDENYERSEIYDVLQVLALSLRKKNKEEQEDIVLDVMDFLVGWSSPHMKL